MPAEPSMRIGTGYDVHAFCNERPLILGGVNVPHDQGLFGHSDADVLTHSIMDAILGALALGDLGHHFPDDDECFRGSNSMNLLEKIRAMLEEQCFRVLNIDSTVIAQQPRLQPYIPKMRSNLASVLALNIRQISVKATTTESLGALGRMEGIAAQAVVLLQNT